MLLALRLWVAARFGPGGIVPCWIGCRKRCRSRHTETVRKLVVLLLAVVVLVPAWLVAPRLNRASTTIAFMGDSLTQGWALPRENFGRYGQTTAQMVQRFQQQVPGHRAVILLGGTNDTLLHVDPAVTLANLDTMVDFARKDGVEPVLAELPPIYRFSGTLQPAVDRLNAGIVRLANQRGVRVVDYNAALRDHPDSYSDGTHLKRRGYLRMEVALLRVKNVF